MATVTMRECEPLGGGERKFCGKRFPWGPIDKLHTIGEYLIAEYRQDYSTMGGCFDAREHGATRFAIAINGEDKRRIYYTLDEALVGVIAIKHNDFGTHADQYACRVLGIKSEPV